MMCHATSLPSENLPQDYDELVSFINCDNAEWVEAARQQVKITGDAALGEQVLEMVSIMA
jgi:hypothetical protein